MPFTPSGCRSGRATMTDLQPASPMPETSRTRSHRRGSFFMCPQVAGLDTQAWTAARVIHRHLFSRLVVMTTQAGLTSGRDRPQAPVGRPGSPIDSETKGARRPAPRGVDRPMHSGASWGRRQVKDHRMLQPGARSLPISAHSATRCPLRGIQEVSAGRPDSCRVAHLHERSLAHHRTALPGGDSQGGIQEGRGQLSMGISNSPGKAQDGPAAFRWRVQGRGCRFRVAMQSSP